MNEERARALTYLLWLNDTAEAHERETGHTVQWNLPHMSWTCAGFVTTADGDPCPVSSDNVNTPHTHDQPTHAQSTHEE